MWYVVKGFTMIIVVPTDISCISVIILIILHLIIIQIILSLSVLPISSFYIYVLQCMAVYSTISSNSCNACVCTYTYYTYVNCTTHQCCSTLHFISFSTKPTQTRYICVPFGQKETITPNLWPGQAATHLTWCCTRNWMIVAWRAVLPPPFRAIFFGGWHFERENRGDEITRKKNAFKDRQDPYERKHSTSYIHQLPVLSLCGCDLVVRFSMLLYGNYWNLSLCPRHGDPLAYLQNQFIVSI